MTTQHQVGQLAKAHLHVAHVIDSAPTGATPEQVAVKAVEALQALGWSPPRDLTETPALRPTRIATEAERQAAMAQIRAVFANLPPSGSGHGDQQHGILGGPGDAPPENGEPA